MKQEVKLNDTEFGNIIPNLLYITLEKQKPGSEGTDTEVCTVQNFQDLKQNITEAIKNGF